LCGVLWWGAAVGGLGGIGLRDLNLYVAPI
jgi:hypothetical protein